MKQLPIAALAVLLCSTGSAAPPETPTFHKDVLPILQRSCQSCHRSGEAAPMSFMSYKETRPWAAAIREAVRTRRMPPWGADPAHGKFSNDPTLAAADIETLVRWASARAPEGNPKDAPPPRAFQQGWNIGTPDVVFEMPKPFEVPAKGTLEYTRFVLPTGFTEDRWITAAEIRPGNRAIVHHVIAYIRPPGSRWLHDAPKGEPVPKRVPGQRPSDDGEKEHVVGYAPGVPPERLEPGVAKLVPAGSDVVLEMHYTTNGKAASDQTRVGFVFAKQPPKERVMTLAVANGRFVIPPGAANHEVKTRFEVPNAMILYGFSPHMHLRGKDFEYTARYPNGDTEVLLRVPRYDFSWQHHYRLAEPKKLEPGTVVECVAHFDNSRNNPNNPDPGAEVRWGDQSWEEMMIGFLEIGFDARKSPGDVFYKGRSQRQNASTKTIGDQ